jgi:ubiquinone/menaquinone biosynthesis C-methylase UbiE
MNRVTRMLTDTRAHAKSKIRVVDEMLGDSPPLRGGTALELGCGAGFASAHLAEKYGLTVVGTDAEDNSIRTAKRKNQDIEHLSFQVADATALPFDGASFDLVLSQNVFHHITDWKSAAEEVARVIRDGGLFLFSDISGPGSLMRLFSRVDKGHGFHHADELVSLLDNLGLKVKNRTKSEGRPQREFAILFGKAKE